MRDLRKLFTENAEQFDALMTEMLAENERLQAKIDSLMLEYCPDEMTPEQIENWKQHQRKAESQYELDSFGPSA